MTIHETGVCDACGFLLTCTCSWRVATTRPETTDATTERRVDLELERARPPAPSMKTTP
jgi:hypothetical protein